LWNHSGPCTAYIKNAWSYQPPFLHLLTACCSIKPTDLTPHLSWKCSILCII